jgi:predicted hotdog family 3-hydroxylacyl-ACP dehydratase
MTTAATADTARLLALPIEALLPHRGMMLFLDAVHAFDEQSLSASARIRGDAWYADETGAMPAWIGIELMAQAIGAHHALRSLRDGQAPRPGVLLGSNRYLAHQPRFAPGAALHIHVSVLLRSEAGHGAYECAIRQAEHLCAEAVIKVFQPDDFQSILSGKEKS